MAKEDNDGHISEQSLEEYSRGALPEAEVEPLEEHLLVCPRCQDRLAEADEFVRAMREAAARLQMEPPSALEEHWRGAWRWLWRPVPVMAACGAVVLFVGATAFWHGGPAAAQATVTLQAMRGDPSSGAHARAGAPLLLKLDAKGLPALSSYRMEIVDAQGTAVFESAVKREPDGTANALSKRLLPGRYWVRLYDPQGGGSLLREFGLTID